MKGRMRYWYSPVGFRTWPGVVALKVFPLSAVPPKGLSISSLNSSGSRDLKIRTHSCSLSNIMSEGMRLVDLDVQ